MTKQKTLFNLTVVCGLWLCLGFTCNSGKRRSSSNSGTTQSGTPTQGDASTDTNISGLPGTTWALIARGKKGETVKEVATPPNVEFCKNGKWWVYHYGGRFESGSYKVQGNRLVMKNEVGSFGSDYQMKQDGSILELDDGENVFHLKADGAIDCS